MGACFSLVFAGMVTKMVACEEGGLPPFPGVSRPGQATCRRLASLHGRHPRTRVLFYEFVSRKTRSLTALCRPKPYSPVRERGARPSRGGAPLVPWGSKWGFVTQSGVSSILLGLDSMRFHSSNVSVSLLAFILTAWFLVEPSRCWQYAGCHPLAPVGDTTPCGVGGGTYGR